MRRSPSIAFAVALAAAALTGCGGGTPASTSSAASGAGSAPGSSTGSSAASSAGSSAASSVDFDKAVAAFATEPASIGTAPPLSASPPQGKKLVQISNGAGYDQVLTKGFEEAAAAAGWRFGVLQAKLADPSTTLSALTTAINSGADAVVISATPMAVWQSELAAAKKSGTLIIVIAGTDDVVTTPPPDGVVYLAPPIKDVSTLADALVTAAVAHLGDKVANGAELVRTMVPQLGAAEVGLGKELSQRLATKCPKCTLGTVEIPIADAFAGKGPSDVVAYLQSHPATKYVLVSRGQSVAGLDKAIRAAGLPDVTILGYAPSPDQLQALGTGATLAWVMQSFQVVAWQGVDIALRHELGDPPLDWPSTFWMATKGNMKQINDYANPVFPSDYAGQFKKLWKLAA